MSTAIKPKPGIYKGVSYRSQLEIKWAEFLHKHIGDEWLCEYADTAHYDFLLSSKSDYSKPKNWFGIHQAARTFIEVKPPVSELCHGAINKAFCCTDLMLPGDRWCLFIGPPPSAYGRPPCVVVDAFLCSHLYGPWIELAFRVNVGTVCNSMISASRTLPVECDLSSREQVLSSEMLREHLEPCGCGEECDCTDKNGGDCQYEASVTLHLLEDLLGSSIWNK